MGIRETYIGIRSVLHSADNSETGHMCSETEGFGETWDVLFILYVWDMYASFGVKMWR